MHDFSENATAKRPIGMRYRKVELSALRYMTRTKRLCAAVWWACLCSASLCGCNSAAGASKIEIVVPAYFYPSAGSDWNDLNAAASKIPITAIMNPFNGPGNSLDANYVAAVNSLRAAGGRVIGYVYTSYTSRPIQQVLSDIDRYDTWYNVDGIFVDEMANTGPAERLNYYRDIYNHIKSIDPNWEVMGNPGTATIEQYLTWPTADRLMVFENVGAAYPGYSPSNWNFSYNRSTFVHLVHTEASLADMLSHLDLAVQRNAGGIYVTDDVLPNPWNRLPTYWSALVDAVAATNADYNSNGVVDAADYVVWRKTDGTQTGYNTWRENFGATMGGGADSNANSAVPEPTPLVIALVGTLAMSIATARHVS
jgi:Spherulation-specific family 4